jgi:hypothetical protein
MDSRRKGELRYNTRLSEKHTGIHLGTREGGRGIGIFCDLTKACNFINHILFAKLNSYGFERQCELVV